MTNRPAMPSLPPPGVAAPSAILNSRERAAVAQQLFEPAEWFVCAGRLLRSWSTSPADVRRVRHACGHVADPAQVTTAGRDLVAIAAQAASNVTRVEATTAPGEAWAIASDRDDLESALVSLGSVARFAPDEAKELLHAVARIERALLERVRELDALLDARIDLFRAALVREAGAAVYERIRAVSHDASAGAWIAATIAATRSQGAPFRLPVTTSEGAVPWIALAPHLFEAAAPATAAGDDEILEAMEYASGSEPVARLDEGRVVVRVCAPPAEYGDGTPVAGIAVEAEGAYDEILDVTLEVDRAHVPPPRRVPPVAWWISLRPLAELSSFAITVRTPRGSFRCEFVSSGEPAP